VKSKLTGEVAELRLLGETRVTMTARLALVFGLVALPARPPHAQSERPRQRRADKRRNMWNPLPREIFAGEEARDEVQQGEVTDLKSGGPHRIVFR
jgi:hypothetical protein